MTDQPASAEDATGAAARAFATGMAEDRLARDRGRLLDPIPIVSPAGEAAGWMVPVELGGAMLGFVQLLADGTFHRYSAFARQGDSTIGCPSTDDWLNPDTIRGRAADLVGTDHAPAAIVLSYDRSPDRLVWSVTVTAPDGQRRLVHVAGDSAWLATPDGPDEVTGGG